MNECLMKCGNEIEKQKLNEADFLLKFCFFQLRDGGSSTLHQDQWQRVDGGGFTEGGNFFALLFLFCVLNVRLIPFPFA